LSVRIVDRYAGHSLVILKLVDECVQFKRRSPLKNLLGRPQLAFGQYQCLPLDLLSHGMHLHRGVIEGEDHENDGRTTKQGQYQSAT